MRICSYSYFGDNGNPITADAVKNLRTRYPSIRRSDRYTAIFALAALDALERAEIKFPAGSEIGLVGVTAFGPHLTTFAMINEIIEFQEDEILPTKFSHSVLNAAASYVNAIAGINGPTFALCGFDDVWFDAVALAQSMLEAGECRQVLVAAGDEKTLLTENLARFIPGYFPIEANDAGLAMVLDNDSSGRQIHLDYDSSGNEMEFFFGAQNGFRAALNASGDVTLRKSHR